MGGSLGGWVADCRLCVYVSVCVHVCVHMRRHASAFV